MAKSRSPRPDPASLEIINVLLLDDDTDILAVLKNSLETQHFVVTTAKNGVEGLKEVIAQDFDIILCDLMMPTMPGDMFYIAVQRTKPFLSERFIFITGCSESPKMAEFLKRVRAPVVTKPFKPEHVTRAIAQVLSEAAPLMA